MPGFHCRSGLACPAAPILRCDSGYPYKAASLRIRHPLLRTRPPRTRCSAGPRIGIAAQLHSPARLRGRETRSHEWSRPPFIARFHSHRAAADPATGISRLPYHENFSRRGGAPEVARTPLSRCTCNLLTAGGSREDCHGWGTNTARYRTLLVLALRTVCVTGALVYLKLGTFISSVLGAWHFFWPSSPCRHILAWPRQPHAPSP